MFLLYDRVEVMRRSLKNDPKRPLPPQEQLSTDELKRLIDSDRPEDWQRVEASLDAEIEAMTPEERAEFDLQVDQLQWRIAKILEASGRKVFN